MKRLAILVSLYGCAGETDLPEFTTDVRLDKAAAGQDPDSFGTQMCVSPDGVVYVIWLDDREDIGSDKYDVWLNRSVNRGGGGDGAPPSEDAWLSAAVKVNQGEGGVFEPELFCNELGVYVVWEDDRDGQLSNHNIYFNHSENQGETFQPEDVSLDLDSDGMSMSLGPQITGHGPDLFVTWYDNLNGAYDIYMASSGDAGATWRDPVRVDADQPAGSAYSSRPKIAVSENTQDVWIAWEDSRDGKADIYLNHSGTGGTTFDDDERLDGGDDEGSADSFEPVICSDGDQNVTVAWHDARSGQYRDIFVNASTDGGDNWFASAVRLDGDAAGFANSLFPKCVQDSTTTHLVWADNRTGNYDVYYRSVTDGIPNAEERVDAGTPEGFANSLSPQIARNDDAIVVAWQDSRNDAGQNGYDDLFYNYSDGSGAWRTEEEDGDFRVDSMYDGQSYKVDLQLTVLGGELYAAWTDGRNGTSDVYFQRLPIGEAAKPPPLEALGEQTAGR